MRKLDQLPRQDRPGEDPEVYILSIDGVKTLVNRRTGENRLLLPEFPDRYKQALDDMPW